MSYLSLLFGASAQGTSPALRELRTPKSEIRIEERDFGSPTTWGENEQMLPSGVASMEHWLDLNA